MSDQTTKFRVFRAATAPTLEQTDVLRFEGITPVIADGLRAFVKAGGQEGSFAKILINVPGFSLAYAWHKSDYPLPLHSHDVDCCYLIIAGELIVGNEALGKADGFFVPAGVAYTFFTGARAWSSSSSGTPMPGTSSSSPITPLPGRRSRRRLAPA
jgi:hypothetical protein